LIGENKCEKRNQKVRNRGKPNVGLLGGNPPAAESLIQRLGGGLL